MVRVAPPGGTTMPRPVARPGVVGAVEAEVAEAPPRGGSEVEEEEEGGTEAHGPETTSTWILHSKIFSLFFYYNNLRLYKRQAAIFAGCISKKANNKKSLLLTRTKGGKQGESEISASILKTVTSRSQNGENFHYIIKMFPFFYYILEEKGVFLLSS